MLSSSDFNKTSNIGPTDDDLAPNSSSMARRRRLQELQALKEHSQRELDSLHVKIELEEIERSEQLRLEQAIGQAANG